jgi:small subunit ribosomal protein S6
VNNVREYELVYILDPDLSDEGVNELMTRFQTLANTQGAEIQSQERWEKRRLAYEIKDKREGIYVVMELQATPAAVQEMERILRITDGVLRHMMVRAEEFRGKTGVAPTDPKLQETTAPPPAPAAPETPVAEANEEAAPAEVPDTEDAPEAENAPEAEASETSV